MILIQGLLLIVSMVLSNLILHWHIIILHGDGLLILVPLGISFRVSDNIDVGAVNGFQDTLAWLSRHTMSSVDADQFNSVTWFDIID